MVTKAQGLLIFGEYVLDRGDERVVGPRGAVRLGNKALCVLTVLAEARGRLVTKEDLFDCVWGTTVVSESALTSVVKEIRIALCDNTRDPRYIASVYGRGYRFVALVEETSQPSPKSLSAARPGNAAASEEERSFTSLEPVRGIPRRALLGGTGALAALALAYANGTWFRPHRSGSALSPEVLALVTRARDALERSGNDDQDQAIALMRRVVALEPHFADGWGLLGLANGVASHFRDRLQGLDLRAHAEAAARRALDIEPGNGLGELALGVALPLIGAWSAREKYLERALAAAPTSVEVLEYAAVCNIFIDRSSAALPLYDRMPRPFQPQTYANYCQALWRTERLEELDRALDDAASLYPAQPRIWNDRFSIYLYGNRADRALQMLRSPVGRPRDFDANTMARLEEIARAILDPHSALAEKVVSQQAERQRQKFAANNAMRVLAALGRIDEAFRVVEAFFFGKGYVIPDGYAKTDTFTPEQRDCRVLFEPGMRALRADRRFASVVARLGLAAFWRASGKAPDHWKELGAQAGESWRGTHTGAVI